MGRLKTFRAAGGRTQTRDWARGREQIRPVRSLGGKLQKIIPAIPDRTGGRANQAIDYVESVRRKFMNE